MAGAGRSKKKADAARQTRRRSFGQALGDALSPHVGGPNVRRRAMPAQGGASDERRRELTEAPSLEDDSLMVIISQLWRYHRLIPPSSFAPRKLAWDMLVVVLVLYNCFVIPVELCFQTFQDLVKSTSGGQAFQGFEWVVDACFAVDIVLNFRTTHFDSDGEVCEAPKAHACSQLCAHV